MGLESMAKDLDGVKEEFPNYVWTMAWGGACLVRHGECCGDAETGGARSGMTTATMTNTVDNIRER